MCGGGGGGGFGLGSIVKIAAIVVAIVAPEVIPAIGEAFGAAAGSAEAAAVGSAVISGGTAAVEGKSPEQILASAAGGAIGSVAGGAAGEAAGGGIPGTIASGATKGAIGAALTGGDIGRAALTGGAAAGLTSGIKDFTATPGTAENIPGPATIEQPPVAPRQEPGDFAVYDQSGKALTPEQIASQYPDLYPGGEPPKAGEMTEYKPGSKGITLPSSLLARAFNIGLETPTKQVSGGYGSSPGATTGLFGGEGVSVTAPGRAMGGGDVESPKTGGKRRNVWNVASLRNLQEGLGV